MTTVENIRNAIFDKLLTINDENKLSDLLIQIENNSIFNQSNKLKESQKIMLQMGLDDIENGRFVSDEEAYKQDMEWLKTQ